MTNVVFWLSDLNLFVFHLGDEVSARRLVSLGNERRQLWLVAMTDRLAESKHQFGLRLVRFHCQHSTFDCPCSLTHTYWQQKFTRTVSPIIFIYSSPVSDNCLKRLCSLSWPPRSYSQIQWHILQHFWAHWRATTKGIELSYTMRPLYASEALHSRNSHLPEPVLHCKMSGVTSRQCQGDGNVSLPPWRAFHSRVALFLWLMTGERYLGQARSDEPRRAARAVITGNHQLPLVDFCYSGFNTVIPEL